MKKPLIILAIALLSIQTAYWAYTSKTPKRIEKITQKSGAKKSGEVIIPYEKWRLPNGLTILIHEDHSDPIVHTSMSYHVGSNREQAGRSGFAHFFEHMMFEGSKHIEKGQHFKIISDAGGTLNGFTTSDYTHYYETVPSNHLEKTLWLESDRMGFLLDSVTKEKFENQRATVKNERAQRCDNQPYGLVEEKTLAALFPYNHPYSWPTIGYIEDLNRVDVNDLKRFFMRWYGPNNATLTVSGDVNPSEVIKLANKYFGPIAQGPKVKNIEKQAALLDKDRYISYEDDIRFPLLTISYPSVPSYDKDEAALDALAHILAGDKASIFYKNFIKEQLAMEAGADNDSNEIAGIFSFSIKTMPDKTLTQMDSLVRKSMADFEKSGVTDDDLKKFKIGYEAAMINSLGSVEAKGSLLAKYQTLTNNPNQIKADMERYMKITKEDVMRVFNQYIKNKPAVYLSVVPKGSLDMVDRPDNFTPQQFNAENQTEALEYKNLSDKKTKDTFDRTKIPKSGANPVVKVPNFWTEIFPNGLKIIGAKNDEIPSVSIMIWIENGHNIDDLNKSGLAFLTTKLIGESTKFHSAEQISDMIRMLGSSVVISTYNEGTAILISSLTKNIEATLKIVEEMLFAPKFDKADFERLKAEQLHNINDQFTQPNVVADNVYNALLYGKSHIRSTPTIGTKKSVSALTLQDVNNFYINNFSPSIAQIAVVGDIDKESILPKLNFLKLWKARDVKKIEQPQPPKINKTKIYFVNKKGAPQSEIRIGYIAMPYDATGEFYRSYVMNYMLGGTFNSRINMNLRETKGWTYGAFSGFSGSKSAEPFTMQSAVKGDATDVAIEELIKEMKKFASTGSITTDELLFVKNSISQKDALKYETNWQKAGFISAILNYNLPKDFVNKQQDILEAMTKQDIEALAKEHLPYGKMLIVVVGDKAKYFQRLQKLGYEVIVVNSEWQL